MLSANCGFQDAPQGQLLLIHYAPKYGSTLDLIRTISQTGTLPQFQKSPGFTLLLTLVRDRAASTAPLRRNWVSQFSTAALSQALMGPLKSISTWPRSMFLRLNSPCKELLQ